MPIHQHAGSFVIDTKILGRALLVGLVLQVALAVASHFFVYVAQHVFFFGGMMIAATAGYLFGMNSGKGYFSGATGGAIVGGVCGLVAIAILALLHDAGQSMVPLFTAICVLTGAVGGLFGQMAAKLRKMGY